jgi:DNA-nicking Smr family endonuclease
MASAAIRSVMESYLRMKSPNQIAEDLIIITGKGLRSVNEPVLRSAIQRLLQRDYGIRGKIDAANEGRIIVDVETLKYLVSSQSWVE